MDSCPYSLAYWRTLEAVLGQEVPAIAIIEQDAPAAAARALHADAASRTLVIRPQL